MNSAEYRQQQAKAMSEADLQVQVIALAVRLGWMVYHTRDSRGSEPGYPDLHLVHPRQERALFRELKTERGRLSKYQQKWLAALAVSGADVQVWRPRDLVSGRIERELRKP